MLQVSGLQKSYGSQVLFEDVTFTIQRRERVGLLGRNGHGKSTLIKVLLGEEEYDDGDISTPKGYRLGHLPQTIHFTASTVLEETCLGLPVDERDQSWKAERILSGLGFSESDLESSPQKFSGGFQLRINLAKLLLSEPDLLLLDEPTNYLDIVSVRWLQQELQDWRGELIMISHDREFMDSITTHTMMIHRGKVKKAEGNSRKLQALIAEEEEVYEKTRLNQDKRREEAQAFIDRFRAQASKAALVQSRIKELERMGKKEELGTIQSLRFSFTEKPFEAKTLLEARDLTFGYRPGELLIENLCFALRKGARIGVIGKNGRGKSTLMKIIAGELQPLSGETRAHDQVKIGYFGQTNVARLDAKHTVEEEIQAANRALSRTAVRAICGAMMFTGDKAEKRVSVLSGGERSRVLLGKILATPNNLLLLDEPTSHLDIESVEALVESLKGFSGGLMIVTHSEMILRELCDNLIVFGQHGVEFFDGDYEDFLRRRGWEEEGNGPSTKPAPAKTPLAQQPQKSPKGSGRRKKLEEEFKKIDEAIKVNEERLTAASLSQDVGRLTTLAEERQKLEARQLELLELLESA
jgi:ATP-binding cassette, subfamily F, member 3